MTKAELENLRFLGRLRASHPSVQFAAKLMLHLGYEVYIPKTRETPNFERRREFADKGDIFVRLPGDPWKRLDIKHSSRPSHLFSRKKWPYPMFMVCARDPFLDSRPEPIGFIILSSDLTHAAFVDTKTKDSWTVSFEWDRNYSPPIKKPYFMIPTKDVDFVRLVTFNK